MLAMLKLTSSLHQRTHFKVFKVNLQNIYLEIIFWSLAAYYDKNRKLKIQLHCTTDMGSIPYLCCCLICLPAKHFPVFHGLRLPVQGSGDFPRIRLRHGARSDRNDDNVPVHLYAVQ